MNRKDRREIFNNMCHFLMHISFSATHIITYIIVHITAWYARAYHSQNREPNRKTQNRNAMNCYTSNSGKLRITMYIFMSDCTSAQTRIERSAPTSCSKNRPFRNKGAFLPRTQFILPINTASDELLLSCRIRDSTKSTEWFKFIIPNLVFPLCHRGKK